MKQPGWQFVFRFSRFFHFPEAVYHDFVAMATGYIYKVQRLLCFFPS